MGSSGASAAMIQSKINNELNPQSPPTPLQNLLTAQQSYATNFRNNLGTTTNQDIYNNNAGINNQLMATTQQTKNSNAARGMAYGGVNQGQLQGIQSQAQTQAASQGGQIQTGLLNQANQLDMDAISTGIGMQQQSQQMQNAIYTQAMTQQQADNSMFGSAAGMGLMAGIAFSDRRLKTDIVLVGEKNGVNIYEFRFNGDKKKYLGVMAQEILETHPDAVIEMSGHYAVNYDMLGIKLREVY